MGSDPINLVVRFILELAALTSVGLWGWKCGDGWLRFALALGIPVLLAIIWGTFNVPGDPSRSGAAPVVIPGFVRLIIELGIFGFAAWVLKDMGFTRISMMMGVAVLVHYVISYDRIMWLLAR